MASDEELQPITCYSYTFARRFPLVIGKIGGWVPWWGPATPTQYGVGVGSVLLLLSTRSVWAHFGPMNVLILVATPFALAWSLRAARIENRAPYKALLGLLTLLASAPHGTLRGRPVRRTRPVRLGGDPVFVSESPLPALSDRGA